MGLLTVSLGVVFDLLVCVVLLFEFLLVSALLLCFSVGWLFVSVVCWAV